MAKKERAYYSKSLSYHAWQRLKKNKLALFGLGVIGFVALIAIAGPLIRPDKTPKANTQILSIKYEDPGFSVDLIKVRKNNQAKDVGFFTKFVFGQESNYKLIPIYDYRFEGTNVVVEKYTGDEPNDGEEIVYNLADVVYAVDYKKNYKEIPGKGELEFYTFEGDKKSVAVGELRKMVEEDNIYSQTFWLGTDLYGRDILSRLMSGAWISLCVGLIAVSISLVIGIMLGAIAGYFRGWVDDVIMWFITVVWSIPALLMIIAITLAIGKDFWQVFIAVGLTSWVEIARVVRGQVISIREKEFVEAGRALGYKDQRIVLRHVIPNVMGPVIVISASNFASAILIEAGLSFLGLGAKPPQATWGKMISEMQNCFLSGHPILVMLPGFCIMMMVLAFFLLGNGLRDALDTRTVDEYAGV